MLIRFRCFEFGRIHTSALSSRSSRACSAVIVRGGGGASGARQRAAPVTPVALADVEAVEHDRLSTGIGELDNVLGGGITITGSSRATTSW